MRAVTVVCFYSSCLSSLKMRSQKYSAMSKYITASSFNTVCEGKQLHLSQTIQCWCGKHTGLLFICHLLALYWQGTCPVLNIGTAVLRITMLSVQHDCDQLQYYYCFHFSVTQCWKICSYGRHTVLLIYCKIQNWRNKFKMLYSHDFTLFQSIGGRIKKQEQQ